MTTIALVVPSYLRPDSLARALSSVDAQSRPFDEVVVVVRDTDDATRTSLSDRLITVVTVGEPGVLAAMSAGVAATTSDVVAFTDDDAELSRTWCEDVLEILDAPRNSAVGAVGGRDVIYDGETMRSVVRTERVGEVTFWGRLIGNHHRATANNREVVVLKGVNCAYRREALALPRGLRGQGAEAHFEVAVGAFARRAGWRLLYFSDLTVNHRPAPRAGEDQRSAPSDQAVADSAFNLMRALAPQYQTRRWLYVHIVGDRAVPGIVRCAWALLRGDRATLARRAPSWRATTEAWRLRRQRLEFTTFT